MMCAAESWTFAAEAEEHREENPGEFAASLKELTKANRPKLKGCATDYEAMMEDLGHGRIKPRKRYSTEDRYDRSDDWGA